MIVKKIETNIEGLFELDLFHAKDERGSFTKTFQAEEFDQLGLDSEFRESFFSINKKGVVRGMHFQNPPHDHSKLVYCTQGVILDVIVDIRKESQSYGKFASIEISAEKHNAVYIPKGMAHGFCCLTDATMVYLTSTVHNPDSDKGIRFDSFNFEWPVNQVIMSDRDKLFPSLQEFNSPF